MSEGSVTAVVCDAKFTFSTGLDRSLGVCWHGAATTADGLVYHQWRIAGVLELEHALLCRGLFREISEVVYDLVNFYFSHI